MPHPKVSSGRLHKQTFASAEACERMGLLKFNFTPPERVNMVENMADLPLTKEKILSSYKDVLMA